MEAKELTHKAYERIRSSASPSSARARRASRVRVNAESSIPRQLHGIEDFPGKERMAEKITYYAIVDEFTSREQPSRCSAASRMTRGQSDEVFSRDLKWEFSPLLYSAERGD